MRLALLASCLYVLGSIHASPLHDAAVKNDVLELSSLIESKQYDVNGLNDFGQTPLAAAFATCINYTEGQGGPSAAKPTLNTQLATCPAGLWPGVSRETAAILICAGANVNVDAFGRARPGYTLLHLAGCDGVNSINYLLEAGAKLDVRYQPPGGGPSLTPLEWARLCYERHAKAAVYPNPGGSLKGGLDALLAANHRNNSAQRLSTSTRSTLKACNDAEGARKWALQLRDDDVARASYAAKYHLHAAVAANNIAEVKRLIDQHAVDVNAVDNKNLTALQYGLDCDALRRRVAGGYCGARITQSTAEFLVNKGANVRLDFAVRGELQRGFTLLHYAATRGSTDLVKLLLNAGADPNAVWVHKDGEGQIVENEGSYTPLTVAAQCMACAFSFGPHPEADACEALLDAGAEPTIPGSGKPATFAFPLPEHLPELTSELQQCNEVGACTAAEADAAVRRYEQAELHWYGRDVPAYGFARCWHVVWKALNK